MPEKVWVIVNPKAGRFAGSRITEDRVWPLIRKEDNLELSVVFTEPEGENSAENLARRAQKEGVSEIVAAGGEGTIRSVVKGLNLPDSSFSLGIVPIGRVNNLANALRVPRDINKALDLALNGENRLGIDLGAVNAEPYVSTFSIGLDARINERAFDISARLKRIPFWQPLYFLWELPFWWMGIRELWAGISCLPVALKGDILSQTSVVLLAVNNVAKYAHRFKLTPGARVDDGFLDACLIAGPVNRRQMLAIMFKAMRGTHIESPKVSVRQIRELVIESEEPLIAQVDGEPIESATRFEISVFPRALNVIVPPSLS